MPVFQPDKHKQRESRMRVWRILGLAAIIAAAWPAAWANATVDPRTRAPLLRARGAAGLARVPDPRCGRRLLVAPRWLGEPFGLADVAAKRKVEIGDRFAIRSITKSFTVTLILDLVAQGKIKLDDPISRYYQGVPKGNLVTLRQLAGMASGVSDYSSRSGIPQEVRQGFHATLVADGTDRLRHLAPVQVPAGQRVRLFQHQHAAAGRWWSPG